MLSDCLAATTVVAQTSHFPRGITDHPEKQKKDAIRYCNPKIEIALLIISTQLICNNATGYDQ
jgi:hypothetical protein